MAKPNYSFEKRQRDLEKKKKQEEKRQKKLEKKASGDAASPDDASTDLPGGASETPSAG